MITDRTKQDVDRWKELHDKGYANMSTAERTEWLGEMKGRYTHTDMNRVETAVAEINQKLIDLGYMTTTLTTKTNWNRWSVPTILDMTRYLGNIATLRGAMPVYPTTPDAPTVRQRLDYERANDIEKILVDVDHIATMIPQGRFYSGDIYSGEV